MFQPRTVWHFAQSVPIFRWCTSAWQSWQVLPTLVKPACCGTVRTALFRACREADTWSCCDRTQARRGWAANSQRCDSSHTESQVAHSDFGWSHAEAGVLEREPARKKKAENSQRLWVDFSNFTF